MEGEGPLYKTNKKRVVACYRHKNFLRCSTGMVAMSLFTSLFYEERLDFQAFENGDGRNRRCATWWRRRLFSEWKNTNIAAKAYNAVYDANNFRWGKTIHMRSAGIEHASGKGGLDAGQVSTMSKHKTGKLDTVYMTELYPPLMMVMAGFKKNDGIYNVERATLELPWSQREIEGFVFPKLPVWRLQQQSPLGDKSLAAQNLLYSVLPYLAMVVVQDGIFWLRDFKDHEVSKLLLKRMPATYELWAKNARENIEVSQRQRQLMQRSNLDESAANAIMSLSDLVKSEIRQVTTEVQSLRRQIASSAPMNANPPTPAVPQNVEVAGGEPQQQQARLLTEVLRPTPVLPVFPRQLPKTVVETYVQYVSLELGKFEHVKMGRTWPNYLKQSYPRRVYLQNWLKEKAAALHHPADLDGRMRRAAENCDQERQMRGDTVAKYIVYIKSLDPKVRKRKRNN